MKTDTDITIERSESKSWRRYVVGAARILLGLPLAIFGLNGFLNFIPQPETPLPERAMVFVEALAQSGYMMQLIAITQLVAGALLLLNRFVPLALLLLAPFFVNSLAFHVFLEPSGTVMALIFVALEVYLLWAYRAAYWPLLKPRFP